MEVVYLALASAIAGALGAGVGAANATRQAGGDTTSQALAGVEAGLTGLAQAPSSITSSYVSILTRQASDRLGVPAVDPLLG